MRRLRPTDRCRHRRVLRLGHQHTEVGRGVLIGMGNARAIEFAIHDFTDPLDVRELPTDRIASSHVAQANAVRAQPLHGVAE